MQKLTKVEIKWLAEDLATRISLAVQELKTTMWRGEMANFEDTGQYYANDVMQKEFIVLSMNSRLVYDIGDTENVKIIKKTTDEFYAIARADIRYDGPCFYGRASVYTSDEGKLEWEI